MLQRFKMWMATQGKAPHHVDAVRIQGALVGLLLPFTTKWLQTGIRSTTLVNLMPSPFFLAAIFDYSFSAPLGEASDS